MAAPAAADESTKDPVANSLRVLLQRSQNNTIGAVEAMPADKFSYKPTPDQIPFAHLVVHIIGFNNSFCAKAADVSAPKVEEPKESDPKDQLVAAVKASYTFCGDALSKMDDSKLGESIELFGGRKAPRAMAALISGQRLGRPLWSSRDVSAPERHSAAVSTAEEVSRASKLMALTNRDRRTATRWSPFVFACFFLSIAVLSPNSASCAVSGQRMEIQDLSEKGSPIQISGYMAIRYDSENRFPFSYEQSTSVKNVSSKSILLMIVHLEATSGPGRDESYSQEYFFGETLAPGQVETNHDPEQRFGATVVNGEPLPYRKDPHPAAQAHAEFIQFSDGSTWGDADSARDVFEIRRKTLEELDLMEHLYEQAGEGVFLDEFARADDTLNVIRQLKDRCSQNTANPKSAYNAVHRTFLTAKEHEADAAGALNPRVAVDQQ